MREDLLADERTVWEGALADMRKNRYKYFRWTPRTAMTSLIYVVAVPFLVGVLAYKTDVRTPPPLLLCRRPPLPWPPGTRAHTRARPKYICIYHETDRWACYHCRANTTSGPRERAILFPSSRRPMGHAGNGEYNTSFKSGAGGGENQNRT